MNARISLIALIIVGVILNASAQVLLRLAARSGIRLGEMMRIGGVLEVLARPGIILGLLCYGASVLIWIYILSRTEVSFAYPFLGLGFVLVALASHLFLGETLSLQRLFATLLIVIGVGVLALE